MQLKSSLETSSTGDGIAVKELKFLNEEDSTEVKPDTLEVPKSLEKAWNEIKSDGYITKDDYEKLLTSASPNKKNSEFDEKEIKFLSALKDAVSNSKEEKGVPLNKLNFLNLYDDFSINKEPKISNNIPKPPQGVDIEEAYKIVKEDLKAVKSASDGHQIVNIHTQKASDYRNKAEQFSKEAEKESREVLFLAKKLKENPNDNALLSKIQEHKAKATESLATAQEYTKATYEECLYAHAANDTLKEKFPDEIGNETAKAVEDCWKNWKGGNIENKFVFFKQDLKPAEEAFNMSMNAVSANIGQATKIISGMMGGAVYKNEPYSSFSDYKKD